MSKLYYEATIKIMVDTGMGGGDVEMLEGGLAEQLTELHDLEDGTVVVTDLQLRLVDAK